VGEWLGGWVVGWLGGWVVLDGFGPPLYLSFQTLFLWPGKNNLGKFLAFAKSLQFTVNSHSMAAPPTRRDFPWGVKWLLGKQVDAAQRKKMYIN